MTVGSLGYLWRHNPRDKWTSGQVLCQYPFCRTLYINVFETVIPTTERILSQILTVTIYNSLYLVTEHLGSSIRELFLRFVLVAFCIR